ncbi:probable myosin-binding protein 5 isoform X2 [Phragmites australis]|uniref:probable myosin-binding protein 5 isoform X2 n=1 Tax=Phragmites australis TaxID=29695 RepID=UPI002D79D0B1|nr:probable myosin-binding protein 5 isoform X2 [Phragmites australis]
MAPRTSAGKPWRTQQFSALLSSVVLEWVLMLLLLLEGLLSYLVTTFVRLCKLQPPCPMCTRLDHVLGKAHPGFYRDLMCSTHKAEASSWAFCHNHQKLADVHSMCEACLLSFAADKKSNLETYQSLVGKLSIRIGNTGCRNNFSLRTDATEAPVLKEDIVCSCCSRPLKVKSYPSVVLQSKACGIDVEEISRDVSKYQCIDEINYVAYSELKTSDCESEPWHRGCDPRSLLDDATDNSTEDFTFGHPQIKIGDGNPSDDNAQENVREQSESIPVQNGGANKKTFEDSGELCKIQANEKANIQSTDGPSKGDQQITEDSDTRDKSEDDVWHNALSSTEDSSGVAKSAETDAMPIEMKADFSQGTTRKNSLKVHEDLKLLLSQVSTSQAPDIDSHTVQDQGEQAIHHNINRAISLERNYSGISESMVNEFEGECTVDQLKRQIELDRKSISRLWKELEEERNASAVAANQTMAMITRLQEEKAAMQMEAQQYQRMMEEQSEYDREDHQKMAEMVRTLQAEVESYKMKLRDQLLVDEIRDHMRLSCLKEHESSIPGTTKSLSGFEDEKAYISKRLRKLRQKLQEFSNNSNHIPLPDSDDKQDSVDDTNSDDAYEDGETDNLASHKHIGRNGNSFRDLTHGKDDPKGQYHAMVSANDLACFEDEISEVSGRLMALEADRSFLEHSVNSLRNGKEGEELIREIAGSLRELRKMGITWKEYD